MVGGVCGALSQLGGPQGGCGSWWVELASGRGLWWAWLTCSLVWMGGVAGLGPVHLQLEFPIRIQGWEGGSVLARGALDPPRASPRWVSPRAEAAPS